jgi:hypothetical protein
MPMIESFLSCDPSWIRRAVMRALAFCRLPAQAEADVQVALDRVQPQSQILLIQAAEDAGLPDAVAIERLCSLWMMSAAVNLADDLADGDCDYLPLPVAPGVSFLLQSLATALAARGEISATCLEECALGLTRAAAGQSLEVRPGGWEAGRYLRVAELIAGEQYGAHLRLLWEGTPWEKRAFAIGRDIGVVGIALTDVTSNDRRFRTMTRDDRETVLRECLARLKDIVVTSLPSLLRFAEMANGAFAPHLRPSPENLR